MGICGWAFLDDEHAHFLLYDVRWCSLDLMKYHPILSAGWVLRFRSLRPPYRSLGLPYRIHHNINLLLHIHHNSLLHRQLGEVATFANQAEEDIRQVARIAAVTAG